MGAAPNFRDPDDARDVLHNAARVKPDAPDYEEARQAIDDAVQYLDATAKEASAADPERQIDVSPLEAIGIGGFQGATSEFGDEISSIGNDDPQAMRDAARATISASRKQHPWLTGGAEVAGMAVNPVLRAAGALGKGLSRAAQGGWGGALAGGMAGEGMGTGTAKERLPSAAIGAGTGGLLGFGAGKIVGKLEPSARIIGGNVKEAASNMLARLKPKLRVSARPAPTRSPVIGKSGPATAADKEAVVERATAKLGGKPKMSPKAQAVIDDARVQRVGKPYPNTPDEHGAVAKAKATVQQEIKSGVRGPKGGAKVGSRADMAAQRPVELVGRITKSSPEELEAALNNPFVEEPVKAAVRKELERRLLAS